VKTKKKVFEPKKSEAKKTEEIDKKALKDCEAKLAKAKTEIQKIVVGYEDVIETMLRALIADGHILVEGVPGIAKTLMMLALSRVTGTDFKRLQFTPDMLPSDIVGVHTYDPQRNCFTTIKGPIFTNLALVDEINRAPPKVQSALLEAMQERRVTIAGETYEMDKPFLVLATQNTVESLGVYMLPAAQLDRFLFKVTMKYLPPEEEQKILRRNMTIFSIDYFGLERAITKELLLSMQKLVPQIYLGDEVENHIVNIVESTRNPQKYGIKLGKYIQYGASPRASIGLYIAAKAHAFMRGQAFVTSEDVKKVAHDVLAHRINLSYEGQAEEIDPVQIIDEILAKAPIE
jgi:MoxR-like ATPase